MLKVPLNPNQPTFGAQIMAVRWTASCQDWLVYFQDSWLSYYGGVLVCSYSTVPQKIDIKLPLSVNKFMEAAEMDAAQFFQRWKLLSQ